MRLLWELLAAVCLVAALWVVGITARGFWSAPYEYQFLLAVIVGSQIAGAVVFHREARRRR